MPEEPYNYHTCRRHMAREKLSFPNGPGPGASAPDFSLVLLSGGHFHLSDQVGRCPVLMEFASITCPMTAGSRPALKDLFRDFSDHLTFLSIYVREAHPGERYPHHTSYDQKLRHAQDWLYHDGISWLVAVDTLDGAVHRAYGGMSNPAYLIDTSRHVAFRALWAGQEGLLRRKIAGLLEREATGEVPADLGQQRNRVIPLIHGAAEFDYALARGGRKSVEDFRRAMGPLVYGVAKLMSKVRTLVNPGNNPNRSLE